MSLDIIHFYISFYLFCFVLICFGGGGGRSLFLCGVWFLFLFLFFYFFFCSVCLFVCSLLLSSPVSTVDIKSIICLDRGHMYLYCYLY